MKWRGYRQSSNIGSRGGMIAGGGVGALILGIVAMLFGVDPGAILQQGPQQQESGQPAANDTLFQFTSAVLASTEDAWSQVFQQAGQDYPEPQVATFSGMVQSACGLGQSAMGPFYCPRDQTIYIDLSFFTDLRDRFGAAGDFAQAYVIAHEVGHHVQNVTGLLQSGGGNEQSVRQELQADCFAGVWGNIANRQQQILDPGDVEEALTAASAIGDDRLQKMSQGQVVPESFTHGSSAQRVAAFRTGFESGSVNACQQSASW